MAEEDTTYTMRLPMNLKKAFEIAAKSNDITAAQLVRKWMRMYVEDYMKRSAQQEIPMPKRGKK